MATSAIDLSTFYKTLLRLEQEKGFKPLAWKPVDRQQEMMLGYYWSNHDLVYRAVELKAKGSSDPAVLNDFLTQNGYPAEIESLDGYTVVSIIDAMVDWVVEGVKSYFDYGSRHYPCFRISGDNAKIYRVTGMESPLVELKGIGDSSVWLHVPDSPIGDFDLATRAHDLLANVTYSAFDPRYFDVQVPMWDVRQSPDMDWLAGLAAIDSLQQLTPPIAQVIQKLRFRGNHQGARAQDKTVTTLEIVPKRVRPYIIKQPFIAFMTQGGVPLPIAPSYIDSDSWRDPGNIYVGSVEDDLIEVK